MNDDAVRAQATTKGSKPLASWVTGASNESCEGCGLPAMHLHICSDEKCLKHGTAHGHCINCGGIVLP